MMYWNRLLIWWRHFVPAPTRKHPRSSTVQVQVQVHVVSGFQTGFCRVYLWSARSLCFEDWKWDYISLCTEWSDGEILYFLTFSLHYPIFSSSQCRSKCSLRRWIVGSGVNWGLAESLKTQWFSTGRPQPAILFNEFECSFSATCLFFLLLWKSILQRKWNIKPSQGMWNKFQSELWYASFIFFYASAFSVLGPLTKHPHLNHKHNH